MELRLYNTLTKHKEVFSPLYKDEVTLYTCGPTVYDYAHIGNFRTYIFEDVLRRVLEWKYGKGHVKHVMNITDVGHLTDDADMGEDKMEKGSKREGKTAWNIAEFYTKAFQKDMEALYLLPPTIWCKATDHIQEQITLIQKLETKGFTYTISDGVYFDTSKFPSYGKLADQKQKDFLEGARVEKNAEKRNPTDFALWKFSTPSSISPLIRGRISGGKRQMEWDSPWGVGFPGWHIECSAMSMKYLGNTIDIHCGGIDHKTIHHPNEIAQSEAATGKTFVRVWMHGAFLLINSGRMGKSEGNFITLQTLHEKGFDTLAYKYLLFSTHYRKPANFTWDALTASSENLKKIYAFLEKTDNRPLDNIKPLNTFVQAFEKAISDDLNMPKALAVMHEVIEGDETSPDYLQRVKTLLAFDAIFGLDFQSHLSPTPLNIPDDVQQLIKDRNDARKQKDWKKSDTLRKKIESLGYIIKDTPSDTYVSQKK